MGEKIKSEPTTREQRKPLLEAAKAKNPQAIDTALAPLTNGQLENIRYLCRTEWGNILKGDVVLLLERMDALTTARKSTHDSAVETAGVQAPKADTPPSEPSYDELEAELEAAERATGLTHQPQQTTQPAPATRPSQSAPTPQGPSRGTRATPAAPPTSTHVAEGMRRY